VNADAVSALFARVLDLPDVTPEADFFALGGDSLLATRVISAIARESGVELTFGEFLLAPTPAMLAKTIESAPR
jgi:acyl carrier protein